MVRKSIVIGTTVLVVTLLALAAVEVQFLGYVVSEARARVSNLDGPMPAEVLATGLAPDGTTTILAVGDIAACDERPGIADKLPNTAHLLGLPSAYDPTTALATQTAALAMDWADAPILALGDTVYSSGRPVEYADCFEPTWGALTSRILPAPGNHEYKTLGAFGYYDYFGAQAGPDRRGWYAVRAPGWLILSLNSEVDAGPGSEQALWLKEQLEGSGEACILGFYHKPAHSLVERSGRENAVDLFRMLQEGGATMVLNGHNHFYERTAPLDGAGAPALDGGTTAFTVGTGGKTNQVRPAMDTTEATVFGRTGLLRLELESGGYSWAYVDALTRKALDEGTARCNATRG